MCEYIFSKISTILNFILKFLKISKNQKNIFINLYAKKIYQVLVKIK